MRLASWQAMRRGGRWGNPNAIWRLARRYSDIRATLWAKRVTSKRLQRRSRLRRRD